MPWSGGVGTRALYSQKANSRRSVRIGATAPKNVMTNEETILLAFTNKTLSSAAALEALVTIETDMQRRLADIQRIRRHIHASDMRSVEGDEYNIDNAIRQQRRDARICAICTRPTGRAILCAPCNRIWQSCCHCKRIYRVTSGKFIKDRSRRNGVHPACRACLGITWTNAQTDERMLKLIAMREQGVAWADIVAHLGFASKESAMSSLQNFFRKYPEQRAAAKWYGARSRLRSDAC